MKKYIGLYNDDPLRVTSRLKSADVINASLDDFLKRGGTPEKPAIPKKKKLRKIEVEIAPGNRARLDRIASDSQPGGDEPKKISRTDIVHCALDAYLKKRLTRLERTKRRPD